MAKAYYNEFDPYAAQWLRNLISAGHLPAGDVDERSIVDVAPSDLAGYTQCHFFAGIGGWAFAARLAGWPDDRELWTGSPPCQPFSVAGKQLGTDDDRHLWPHMFRLISAGRPAAVMAEQVAAAVGKGWLDGVFADLESIGYACRAAVVPACAVNAPHRRDRLWFVADTNSERLEVGKRDAGMVGAEGFGPERQVLADDGKSCNVADPDSSRRCARIDDSSPGYGEAVAAEGRRGAWDTAGWIIAHDGKARRFEPSILLLVDGVPGRVGRLRAYGNAICVPLAAEIVAAYMDCSP